MLQHIVHIGSGLELFQRILVFKDLADVAQQVKVVIADTGDAEHEVDFFIAEVHALRILQQNNAGLLDGALFLTGAVGDGYAHAHVGAYQLFTLHHGVGVGLVHIAPLCQQRTRGTDGFLLGDGGQTQLDVLGLDLHHGTVGFGSLGHGSRQRGYGCIAQVGYDFLIGGSFGLGIQCRGSGGQCVIQCVQMRICKEVIQCNKQWLEDLVVNQTMQLVRDDAAMESIIAKVMELQNKENTNIPLYEKQLRDAESGIQNMLNAIQAGILTSSTKERLEQLEDTKRELEARIAEGKLAKPKVTEEFIRFWLLRFRKLDMSLKDQRQALVDTFINAIYLYDDKVLITFNYKEGTQTVTFGEATEVATEGNGSDLDCIPAPKMAASAEAAFLFYLLLPAGRKTPPAPLPGGLRSKKGTLPSRGERLFHRGEKISCGGGCSCPADAPHTGRC